MSNLFDQSRREFLAFMGGSAACLATVDPAGIFHSAFADKIQGADSQTLVKPISIKPLPATTVDDLVTAEGVGSRILIRYNEVLNKAGERFGFNNDFIAFFPISKNEALLWVNHESPQGALMMHGNPGSQLGGSKKTAAQVREEQLAVGGSIIRIVRSQAQIGKSKQRMADESSWIFGGVHRLNRRVSALTPIPFARGIQIAGSSTAIGTLANCAGGVTPWGTVLTCEENYAEFYGELEGSHGSDWLRRVKLPDHHHDWTGQVSMHPWHYGWVVEIDPYSGKARKLVAMGRASREGATVTVARDGRAVVYSGDDHRGGCIFKFVSRKSRDLSEGTLYAADTIRGQWIELSWDKNPTLRKRFADQLDVLIHAREAGLAAGATPLDRPEDIEIHPLTGSVFVALTNNPDRGNLHGSLLRIDEEGGNHLSINFQAQTFLAGGPETGFSCPDNLVFDPAGNLFFTTDISFGKLNKGAFKDFGNNGLFVVPSSGTDAGRAIRLASGPVDAELTGPCFTGDSSTLFLSVQHPGEGASLENGSVRHTSSWPHGNSGGKPCPAVVALQNLPVAGARARG
jgi:secreted PhoX family phosphatase